MVDQWEALEKALNLIAHEFVPITKQHCSIREHFEEFFQLFKEKFDEHLKKGNSPPVLCVVPVFHQLRDWKEWKTEIFGEIRYFGCNCNKFRNFINVTSAVQTYISDNTKPFTRTVLERTSDRTLILITLDSDTKNDNLKYSKRHNDRVHVITIPINKHVALRKMFDLPEISFSNDYCIAEMDYKNRPNNLPEIKIKDLTLDIISDNLTDFEKRMAIPALHHSLFATQEYDLYYCFSNVVVDNNKKGKEKKTHGLGGIFVLANKALLSKESREEMFITLFGRLSDKLANRIIHYYQIEESFKHATRSAISQVLARNMSHNINSHVSYRATNIKIKERIKELYKVEN